MRCFVGIPLPQSIRELVLRSCEAIRTSDPTWRDEKWLPAENLHVTLKFVGQLSEDDARAFNLDVGKAVSTSTPFDLPFRSIDAVPGTRRCRMLWASFLDPESECAALAEAIEAVALEYGVEPEERTFKPHATLCRARRPKAIAPLALSDGNDVFAGYVGFMSVPSVTVFSSRLTPRGSVYEEMGAWPLKGV